MKTIKMLVSVLILTMVFACGKDDTPSPTPAPQNGTPPPPPPPANCNCGIVVSKNPALVTVTLQNTCSNNTQTFTVSYAVMDNAWNGDTICMATGTSWRLYNSLEK